MAVITIQVSDHMAESADYIIRTMIAWQLVGRSVDELYALGKEWQYAADHADSVEDRRYARAVSAAADALAGEHHGDDLENVKPMIVTYRGDLEDIIEAAHFGLELADDPAHWGDVPV